MADVLGKYMQQHKLVLKTFSEKLTPQDQPMKTHLRFLALIAFSFALNTQTVWSADAAQVKLQAASIAEIKALVETTGGYKPRDVELSSTAHQMTITIINGRLNSSSIAMREAEANRMVAVIARLIANKTEFSQLPVIHVDYVKRQGKKTETVQRIDFFQSPAGVFVLHKT